MEDTYHRDHGHRQQDVLHRQWEECLRAKSMATSTPCSAGHWQRPQ